MVLAQLDGTAQVDTVCPLISRANRPFKSTIHAPSAGTQPEATAQKRVENPFMPRLERIQPPPQFTLGFTELEWLGYKAWYREGVTRGQLVPEAMEQQGAAQCSTDAECSKKGPGASTPDP